MKCSFIQYYNKLVYICGLVPNSTSFVQFGTWWRCVMSEDIIILNNVETSRNLV
jgi:hypothetical protein